LEDEWALLLRALGAIMVNMRLIRQSKIVHRKGAKSAKKIDSDSIGVLRRYDQCPLCATREIKLGRETLAIASLKGRKVEVSVRRWKCDHCGEAFLTAESRREMDEALRG